MVENEKRAPKYFQIFERRPRVQNLVFFLSMHAKALCIVDFWCKYVLCMYMIYQVFIGIHALKKVHYLSTGCTKVRCNYCFYEKHGFVQFMMYKTMVMSYKIKQTAIRYLPGALLERVQRVHLHPLKFGNGCNAPVLNGTLSTY